MRPLLSRLNTSPLKCQRVCIRYKPDDVIMVNQLKSNVRWLLSLVQMESSTKCECDIAERGGIYYHQDGGMRQWDGEGEDDTKPVATVGGGATRLLLSPPPQRVRTLLF